MNVRALCRALPWTPVDYLPWLKEAEQFARGIPRGIELLGEQREDCAAVTPECDWRQLHGEKS